MLRHPEYPMLVIDAGNTSVKFAMVARSGGAPRFVQSAPTAKLTAALAKRFGAKAKFVAVSSVVPAASRILKKVFPNARFIGPRTKVGFATRADRKTIGSDRLANVAAASARHGAARCVGEALRGALAAQGECDRLAEARAFQQALDVAVVQGGPRVFPARPVGLQGSAAQWVRHGRRSM